MNQIPHEQEMSSLLGVLRAAPWMNHEYLAIELYKAGVGVKRIHQATGVRPSCLPQVLAKYGMVPDRCMRVDEDLEAAAVAMIQEGKPVPASHLAKRLGISDTTLRRIAKTNGLKLWTARERT